MPPGPARPAPPRPPRQAPVPPIPDGRIASRPGLLVRPRSAVLPCLVIRTRRPVIRRGCPSHVAGTAWMWHPRRITWPGAAPGRLVPGSASARRTPRHGLSGIGSGPRAMPHRRGWPAPGAAGDRSERDLPGHKHLGPDLLGGGAAGGPRSGRRRRACGGREQARVAGRLRCQCELALRTVKN